MEVPFILHQVSRYPPLLRSSTLSGIRYLIIIIPVSPLPRCKNICLILFLIPNTPYSGHHSHIIYWLPDKEYIFILLTTHPHGPSLSTPSLLVSFTDLLFPYPYQRTLTVDIQSTMTLAICPIQIPLPRYKK